MIGALRIISAALLVSTLLTGCGNGGGWGSGGVPTGGTNYGDEEFTIVLLIFHGPNHSEAADYYRKKTESATGWKNLRTIAKEGASELQWGKYRSVQAAGADLARARGFKAPGSGECIYARAMVVPVPGVKVGPPEWDLQNTPTGIYTVNIAVFFDVPDADYYGRKKLAVEYCRQLRKDGYEAYYFHDVARSAVCIGTFGPESVKRRGKNLAPQYVNPNAEEYDVDDPIIENILQKFPKLAVNGREELVRSFDTATGKWGMIPALSCVVRIPRNANATSQDRPGNP